MSQYCACQASCQCHISVPKLRDYTVRIGKKKSTTLKSVKTWTILLYSAKYCNGIGSEIRKLWAFTDSGCMSGARASSHCIPELLVLKGLRLLLLDFFSDGGKEWSHWIGYEVYIFSALNFECQDWRQKALFAKMCWVLGCSCFFASELDNCVLFLSCL